MPPFAS